MIPALVDGPVQVFHGDALDVLREMPDESVHMVLTSPPYWGLRNYNEPRQLGLEPTPDEYVANMVRVFREVRRVLRSDGTCWLNLGDLYGASTTDLGGGRHDGKVSSLQRLHASDGRKQGSRLAPGLKPKDLVMMPARVAMALQADGWWIRSEIVWAKKAPMPESVQDRPTSAHEKIFLLTKAPRYFFDQEAAREEGGDADKTWAPHSGKQGVTGMEAMDTASGRRYTGFNARWTEAVENGSARAGRNMRNVWHLGPEPYNAAHFAVFPSEIPLRAIKAGTSERGCCPDCGAPWRRTTTTEYVKSPVHGSGSVVGRHYETGSNGFDGSGMPRVNKQTTTTGWEPTCTCGNEATVPCTVLDPFLGSGTTAAVARRLGRRAIGIELSQSYIDTLIRPRISGAALPLLEWLQEDGG